MTRRTGTSHRQLQRLCLRSQKRRKRERNRDLEQQPFPQVLISLYVRFALLQVVITTWHCVCVLGRYIVL